MTEFKRVGDVVAKVGEAVTRLADHAHVEADVEASAALVADLRLNVLPDLHARVEKLLGKAREKDPDRQIYNETMRGRIETLAVEAHAVIEAAENTFAFVDRAYRVLVEERTRARAEAQHLASNVSELCAHEHDTRAVLNFAESDERQALRARSILDRDAAFERFRDRIAEEERAEAARRDAELRDAEKLQSELLIDPPRSVSEYLEGISDAERRSTVGHLRMLLEAICADPANEGVRKLRNDHPAVLAHFGHPCAEAVAGQDPTPAEMAKTRYHAVEAILFAAGFRPRYATHHQGTVGSGGPGWRVGPSPWAAHGERFLELVEPDALEHPEAWEVWMTSLRRVCDAVRSYRT